MSMYEQFNTLVKDEETGTEILSNLPEITTIR